MSTHTVLLISIGPVQDLIASARRCRDLWFGSWLLADAARAAACSVADSISALGTDSQGCDALVFPGAVARNELERERGVANRILARVPGDESVAAKIAVAASDAARARLDELGARAFDQAERSSLGHHFLRERAQAQVKDLLDIQWVIAREVDGYDAARKRADQWLNARKQTRIWDPPGWSDTVPKSSIDGLRESVLHENLFNEIQKGLIAPKDAFSAFRVHSTERLCGIGLLKRLATEGADERFFSTSHLAAIPWLVGAAKHPDVRAAFERYATCLRKELGAGADQALDITPSPLEPFGRADGQILFEGRLQELVEEISDTPESKVAGTKLTTELRVFRKAVGMREPVPYFAVLVADGDRMGRAIDEIADHAGHRALSRALARFSDEAGAIVRRHLGSLVYSGGDDVLALLPLHSAVRCARELRDSFTTTLASVTPSEVTPTLSVGLGIGHHLTPLQETLDLARRAERLAKKERDSLAILVDKRGGSELAITGMWSDPLPLDMRLARFVDALRSESIPDKAAFELEALDRLAHPTTHHPGLQGPPDESLAKMLKAEVARVLSRRRSDRGKTTMDPKLLSELASEDPGRTGRELQVARLLAEADALANPKPDAAKPSLIEEVSP